MVWSNAVLLATMAASAVHVTRTAAAPIRARRESLTHWAPWTDHVHYQIGSGACSDPTVDNSHIPLLTHCKFNLRRWDDMGHDNTPNRYNAVVNQRADERCKALAVSSKAAAAWRFKLYGWNHHCVLFFPRNARCSDILSDSTDSTSTRLDKITTTSNSQPYTYYGKWEGGRGSAYTTLPITGTIAHGWGGTCFYDSSYPPSPVMFQKHNGTAVAYPLRTDGAAELVDTDAVSPIEMSAPRVMLGDAHGDDDWCPAPAHPTDYVSTDPENPFWDEFDDVVALQQARRRGGTPVDLKHLLCTPKLLHRDRSCAERWRHVPGSRTEATDSPYKCALAVAKHCEQKGIFTFREGSRACHCRDGPKCNVLPTPNDGLGVYSLNCGVPEMFKGLDMEAAAEAVRQDFPSFFPQQLINQFVAAGAKMDTDIIPMRSRNDFVNGPVLLARLSGWAVSEVSPSAFACKWKHGRARPEEVAWAIKEGTLKAPDAIKAAIDGMALESKEEFTRYPEGSPKHPSFPAMHSAASSASLWLSVVMDLTEEQVDEARRLDFAVSRFRSFAGVHYDSDNRAGLMIGQNVVAKMLPEFLANVTGANKTKVEQKIEQYRTDWFAYADTVPPRRA